MGCGAVSKIALNSFWGKFGQRNNLTKTEYFADPEPFFATVTDPTLVVKIFDFPHEFLAQVQYTHEDDFLEILPNTNVVIAAFTTCHMPALSSTATWKNCKQRFCTQTRTPSST